MLSPDERLSAIKLIGDVAIPRYTRDGFHDENGRPNHEQLKAELVGANGVGRCCTNRPVKERDLAWKFDGLDRQERESIVDDALTLYAKNGQELK
jgi:hypothetical protein